MGFDEDVRRVDAAIEQGYLDLVTNSYAPLFEGVKERATRHMISDGVFEIDLGIRSGLVFRTDGKFYDGHGCVVRLKNLPKVFQDESDYNAGCADDRHHVTPTVHGAMRFALRSFREKVRRSLASSV